MMNRTRKSQPLTLVAAMAALIFSGSVMAEAPIRLNFGVYSSNKPSAMVKIFKPTLQELEDRMSVKLQRDVDIRMQIAKDYDQGIEHLTNGKVDFSRFGPASYIEAKRMNQNLRILAVENIKNAKVFYGIIAVGSNSPITDISQLRGKSFAFGDESSTIGRYLSQLHLEKNGILATDLSKYEYLGRHDKVGTAVGAGDFAAGALNESTFKKLLDKDVKIRELARFPNVTKPWIARSGLSPEIFAALRDSLLEITDKSSLKGLKVDGFLPGEEADYDDIRTAIGDNHLFFLDKEKQAENKAAAAQTAPVAEPVVAGANPETNPLPVVVADPVVAPRVANTSITANPASGLENGNGNITINISLPQELFQPTTINGKSSSRNITINLTVPAVSERMDSVTSSAQASGL